MRRLLPIALACLTLTACAQDPRVRMMEIAVAATPVVIAVAPLALPVVAVDKISDAGPEPRIEGARHVVEQSLDLKLGQRRIIRAAQAFPAGPNRILLLQMELDDRTFGERWSGRLIVDGRFPALPEFTLPVTYRPRKLDGDRLILDRLGQKQTYFYDFASGEVTETGFSPPQTRQNPGITAEGRTKLVLTSMPGTVTVKVGERHSISASSFDSTGKQLLVVGDLETGKLFRFP